MTQASGALLNEIRFDLNEMNINEWTSAQERVRAVQCEARRETERKKKKKKNKTNASSIQNINVKWRYQFV